jgi:PAS domain S-box-containing protein
VINNTEIFSAYEYLPTPLIIFSNESVIYANEKAKQLLALPKNPSKKQLNIFNYILPEFRGEILSRNNKIFAGKKLAPYAIKIRSIKGKVIDIETKSRKVLISKKQYILTIFYDVTEQKLKYNELEEAKKVLELIGSNNTDVVFKYDLLPKEQYSYVSDSVTKILGYKPSEWYKNKDFYEKIMLPEDQKKFPRSTNAYLNYIQKNNKILVRFHSKNRSVVWLETIYNVVRDQKGKISSVICVGRDVTKEKETEASLQITKEQLNLIANNAHDVIYFYTYHPKPKYIFISNSVEKILGYKPEQFYKDAFFISKHTLGKTNAFKTYEQQVRNDQLKGKLTSNQIKYQVKNAKGELVWMEDHVNPVFDEKGKISFLFGIIRNINELKEKEIELNQKWSDYKLLLDQSPISFFIHSNGLCLMCNKAAVELLKVRSEKDIIGKFIINYIVPEQRQRAMERMRLATQGTEFDFLAYQINDSKNKSINVEIKTVPIRYNGIDCVLSLVKDISERELFEKGKIKAELIKEHNKELTNQKNKLTSIFENSSHLVWTIDDNYNFTYFNNNFVNIFKRNYGVDPIIGKTAYEIVPNNKREENRNTWYPLYKRVFKGEQIVFERKDPLDNQSEIYREVYLNPIFSANGDIKEIACMASDISENKRNQKKLIEQSAKLSSIFEMSSHYIWTVDKNNNLTSYNKNYTALIQKIYGTSPVIGKPLNRGKMLVDDEYIKGLENNYKRALAGEKLNFELELGAHSNENVYLDVFLNPVFEKDTIVEVSGIAHDITASKRNEERTIQSLKEKEVLLKEVHHRVKNNMQIISSILNLQSSYVSDTSILNLLRESQNRIKTMAYIHESLYQNKTFSSINFNDYLVQLINNIVHSYSVSPDKIHLEVNCEKTILNLDTSIPLGLIINELVTNSIKHAFPASSRGKIAINLRTQNKFVFLTVKDNGVGMDPTITPENSGTLGLQLVYTLIDQINGKIEFENLKPQGTRINITFLI